MYLYRHEILTFGKQYIVNQLQGYFMNYYSRYAWWNCLQEWHWHCPLTLKGKT